MKNKIIGIVLCLAMLFSFAACGGKQTSETTSDTAQTTAAEENKVLDFEVKEYGYMIDNGFLFVSAILHNPNKDTAIELPSFRMTATAKDGSVLGTSDQTLSVIYPEQDFAYAGQAFEVKGEIAEFTLEPIPTKDYNFVKVADMEHPAFKQLKVDKIKWVEDEFFPKYTGIIINENDYDISNAIVTVLYRDADGKLAGGDDTFVDSLAAGKKTPFELNANDAAKGKTYEIYANNWI